MAWARMDSLDCKWICEASLEVQEAGGCGMGSGCALLPERSGAREIGTIRVGSQKNGNETCQTEAHQGDVDVMTSRSLTHGVFLLTGHMTQAKRDSKKFLDKRFS